MYQEIIKETADEIRDISANDSNLKTHISYGVQSIISELKINNFDIIKFFQESISPSVKTMRDVKDEIEDELRHQVEQG